MSDCTTQQVELEVAFTNTALAQTALDLAEAVRGGQLDRIPAADRVVAHLFTTLRDALQAVVDTKVRGPGAALRGWLRAVPVDTLTVLTLRRVIADVLSLQEMATVQRMGCRLGQAVVEEALVLRAAAVNEGYLNATWGYLKEAGTTSQRHIHKTMQAVVRNVLGESEEMHLSNTEYLNIGKHCLNACLQIGLLDTHRTTNRNGTLVYFTLDDKVRQQLETGGLGFIRAAAPAMIAPPAPWGGAYDGGYLTAELRVRFPLTACKGRPVTRRQRREGMAEAGPVLACANYLQATPFKVHHKTLQVLLRVWDAGGGALGIPRREGPIRPEFPFPASWDKEKASPEELDRFRAWKRDTARWHTEALFHRSVVSEVGGLIAAARRHGEADLYFPAMVDFRGRYYYRGSPNPQGGDAAKAILHFAEKKPLGSTGLFWLKVQIANTFGYDKTSFQDRAAWVDMRLEALKAGLHAPEDSDLYRGADSPLCAVAACSELFSAIDSGDPAGYCTGLPIHMDATCSGLQHFSALLRDPVGARFTNLSALNGERKEDIYMHVAALAKAKVQRHAADESCKDHELAKLWLDIEITRNLAKKPVMTFPYGATARGVADFVADHLTQQGWHAEGFTTNQMGMYMGRVLFAAVEDTVPAAAACMRWLRERAADAKRDAPMVWHTPAGMRVVQDYQASEEKRVDIRSCGLSKVVVREYLDTTKLPAMKNAISPNFVHGLDAAHLTRVALRMRDTGHCMVGIHDSYGTHPSSVEEMHRAIREEFVRMYAGDVLGDFLRDISQEEVSPPPTGTFDLNEVLSSMYFFC